MTSAFDRYLTVEASTLRHPAMSGGLRPSAAATSISSLYVMALIPASAEARLQIQTEAPMSLYETYCDGDQDVLLGDILVVASAQYQIKGVEAWTWSDGVVFHRLILEKMRT